MPELMPSAAPPAPAPAPVPVAAPPPAPSPFVGVTPPPVPAAFDYDEWAARNEEASDHLETIIEKVTREDPGLASRLVAVLNAPPAAPSPPPAPVPAGSPPPPAPVPTPSPAPAIPGFLQGDRAKVLDRMVSRFVQEEDQAERKEMYAEALGGARELVSKVATDFPGDQLQGKIAAAAVTKSALFGTPIEKAVEEEVAEWRAAFRQTAEAALATKQPIGNLLVPAGGIPVAPPKAEFDKMTEREGDRTFQQWLAGDLSGRLRLE